MSALAELVKSFDGLDEDSIQLAAERARQIIGDRLWTPNEGPQTDAYMSEADVTLYGGQAGGGKTHLELGWGVNEAQSGIIFRREATQLDGLEKEGKGIIGARARYNGANDKREWTWPNGKTLKLAGMKDPDDWNNHAGRERDYYAFDEAGEFLEMQVAQIIAWLRAPKGRRCRVILGSNPPRTSDGLWLVRWFAPWLDDKFTGYGGPAVPGELRYAIGVMDESGDQYKLHWVEGPGEYEFEGETYGAKSYTFIPASLHDNPYRDTPEYRAQLQSLPEPLRSQLLYGKFSDRLEDLANQVIPTSWVRAAQARWTERRPDNVPQCALGIDCSGGGSNPMVIAPRYDWWIDRLIKIPGKDIPAEKAGRVSAGFVVAERKNNSEVVVDMGGGYGGPLFEHLHANRIKATGYKGAEKTSRKTRDGKLGFTNVRSAAYWNMRERLDPDQPGGSRMALPPDPRLLAGLTAPTYELTPQGIKIEPKVKRDEKGNVVGGVMHKLGFSPDEADAVVEACFYGDWMETAALKWLDAMDAPATAQMSRQPLSRRTPNSAHRRQPMTAQRRN